ncbi:hypothetical protein SAMN05660649_03524 [Desulfotomaculum arcticum]|uniref:Uncharacterized protein n=1 Tax=Desulfotruncus arcticus DSM 17038 TaxID=1121424 RepID=A0A1I2WP52_9FIRM|nr:hypothetical protein [Desulfotruncus arcticus]SFH02146.1 hypothetical protein SAMN05660649_03524 [Desulfotomaculum arcticum] [Desulfotruncus arcticus DSM 17038]
MLIKVTNEFTCSICRDGIHIDWPDEMELDIELQKLFTRIDQKKKILDANRPLPPEVVENLREFFLVMDL